MLEAILTLIVAAPFITLAGKKIYEVAPATPSRFTVSSPVERPAYRVIGQDDNTPELTANFKRLLAAGCRIRQGRFGLYYLYSPNRLPQVIPSDVPERLVQKYVRMSEQYDLTGAC